MPDLPELEAGNDRLALEHDQTYAERLKIVEEITTLLKSLVKKFRNELEIYDDYSLKIKGCILWSCVLLLARPLTIMDVSVTSNGDSTMAKVHSDELMQILNQLCFNHLTLVDANIFCHNFKLSPLEGEEKMQVWANGITTVFFNHLSMNDPQIPLCYDPLFVLHKLLEPICITLDFQPGTSHEYLRIGNAQLFFFFKCDTITLISVERKLTCIPEKLPKNRQF